MPVWWHSGGEAGPVASEGRHEDVVEAHPWRSWDGTHLGGRRRRCRHDRQPGVSRANRESPRRPLPDHAWRPRIRGWPRVLRRPQARRGPSPVRSDVPFTLCSMGGGRGTRALRDVLPNRLSRGSRVPPVLRGRGPRRRRCCRGLCCGFIGIGQKGAGPRVDRDDGRRARGGASRRRVATSAAKWPLTSWRDPGAASID